MTASSEGSTRPFKGQQCQKTGIRKDLPLCADWPKCSLAVSGEIITSLLGCRMLIQSARFTWTERSRDRRASQSQIVSSFIKQMWLSFISRIVIGAGYNTELFQLSLCSSTYLKPLRLFCLLSAPWWFYPAWGIMALCCLVQPERSLGLFLQQPFQAANQNCTSMLSLLLEIISFIYLNIINWENPYYLVPFKYRIRWSEEVVSPSKLSLIFEIAVYLQSFRFTAF